MREPTLENSGGQKQIFTLHNSPLQIHSPGHRRPTGQDPKIWERRYREPASALKSPPPSLSPLPMGVGLESPPLSQMSTRVQVSTASTVLDVVPCCPVSAGCLQVGLAEAAHCVSFVLWCQECHLVHVLREAMQGESLVFLVLHLLGSLPFFPDSRLELLLCCNKSL